MVPVWKQVAGEGGTAMASSWAATHSSAVVSARLPPACRCDQARAPGTPETSEGQESCPLPALPGPVLCPSQRRLGHARAPAARLCSLTVEGDAGEPLEQGDASAQLLRLAAGPLQLCSVAPGDGDRAQPSGSSWAGLPGGESTSGKHPRLGLRPCPGLTPLPAAPWRRLARSERCPGPHPPRLLPWRSARSQE